MDKIILSSIACIMLTACSSQKEWSGSDKRMAYQTCLIKGTRSYCSCLIRKISTQYTQSTAEKSSLELINNGYDITKIRTNNAKKFLKIQENCLKESHSSNN